MGESTLSGNAAHHRGAPPPAQLPSGKHGLPRREVARNQRARILCALTLQVAEKGYAGTTIAEICSRARLSRRTFYEHFEDKEDCFLAAFDAAVDRISERIDIARRCHHDWGDQLSAALEAFVDLMVSEPELGKLCLVEVAAAGPLAIERRQRAIQHFAAHLLELRRCMAGGREPDAPPIAAELFVGGVQQIVNARLMDGRAASLYEDLPEMVYCAVLPYGGPRRAAEVASRTRSLRFPRAERAAALSGTATDT